MSILTALPDNDKINAAKVQILPNTDKARKGQLVLANLRR